jgi:hypothetical protein
LIYFTARWLMENFDGTLYYGGDNRDYVDPVSREELEEINTHFLRVGFRPYRAYFERAGQAGA